MTHSPHALRRQRFAAILVAAGAITVGACSSPSTGPWFSSGASPTRASAGRAVAPLVAYSFSPVSYPTAGVPDEITGVDNTDGIVGTYLTTAGQYNSFTAQCNDLKGNENNIDCSSAVFSPAPYNSPNAGVYLNAVTDPNQNNGPAYDAGYVITSANPNCSICAVLRNQKNNRYTLIYDNKEGKAPCNVTELLGLNSSLIAVGFYEVRSATIVGGCKHQAFEWYENTDGTQTFVDFSVPGASDSIAWGINNLGDVVGTATIGSAKEAWYYNDFNYAEFSLSGESLPEARAINFGDDIVGDYKDPSSGITHGFYLHTQKYQLQTPSPQFTTLDYSSSSGVQTIVSDITDTHYIIAGWSWVGSSAATQGFVGNCASGCFPSNPSIAGRSRSPRASRKAGVRGGSQP